MDVRRCLGRISIQWDTNYRHHCCDRQLKLRAFTMSIVVVASYNFNCGVTFTTHRLIKPNGNKDVKCLASHCEIVSGT
jgi:hypothetical protein